MLENTKITNIEINTQETNEIKTNLYLNWLCDIYFNDLNKFAHYFFFAVNNSELEFSEKQKRNFNNFSFFLQLLNDNEKTIIAGQTQHNECLEIIIDIDFGSILVLFAEVREDILAKDVFNILGIFINLKEQLLKIKSLYTKEMYFSFLSQISILYLDEIQRKKLKVCGYENEVK